MLDIIKDKAIIGIMAIVAIITIGVIIVIYNTVDNEPPVIMVGTTDITYTEGESYDSLLKGVTAQDKKEGDVSYNLIVECVVPIQGETKAKVIYAACDSKNNVAKSYKIVNYKKPVIVDTPEDDQQAE